MEPVEPAEPLNLTPRGAVGGVESCGEHDAPPVGARAPVRFDAEPMEETADHFLHAGPCERVRDVYLSLAGRPAGEFTALLHVAAMGVQEDALWADAFDDDLVPALRSEIAGLTAPPPLPVTHRAPSKRTRRATIAIGPLRLSPTSIALGISVLLHVAIGVAVCLAVRALVYRPARMVTAYGDGAAEMGLIDRDGPADLSPGAAGGGLPGSTLFKTAGGDVHVDLSSPSPEDDALPPDGAPVPSVEDFPSSDEDQTPPPLFASVKLFDPATWPIFAIKAPEAGEATPAPPPESKETPHPADEPPAAPAAPAPPAAAPHAPSIAAAPSAQPAADVAPGAADGAGKSSARSVSSQDGSGSAAGGTGPVATGAAQGAGNGGGGASTGDGGTALTGRPGTPVGLKGRRGLGPPEYPEASKRRGEQGLVVLQVEVLGDGHVGQVKVITDAGFPRLARAAVDKVRTEEFIPATLAGKPVEDWVTVPYRFQLVDRR